MDALRCVILALVLAVLPVGIAQAHDRGGNTGLSLGIFITNDRDGRDRYDDNRGFRGRDHRRVYGHESYYRDGGPYGRGHGLRGCHIERSIGYVHGRRAEIGTTVCYNKFGRPVALAGSSYVIRYRHRY